MIPLLPAFLWCVCCVFYRALVSSLYLARRAARWTGSLSNMAITYFRLIRQDLPKESHRKHEITRNVVFLLTACTACRAGESRCFQARESPGTPRPSANTLHTYPRATQAPRNTQKRRNRRSSRRDVAQNPPPDGASRPRSALDSAARRISHHTHVHCPGNGDLLHSETTCFRAQGPRFHCPGLVARYRRQHAADTSDMNVEMLRSWYDATRIFSALEEYKGWLEDGCFGHPPPILFSLLVFLPPSPHALDDVRRDERFPSAIFTTLHCFCARSRRPERLHRRTLYRGKLFDRCNSILLLTFISLV